MAATPGLFLTEAGKKSIICIVDNALEQEKEKLAHRQKTSATVSEKTRLSENIRTLEILKTSKLSNIINASAENFMEEFHKIGVYSKDFGALSRLEAEYHIFEKMIEATYLNNPEMHAIIMASFFRNDWCVANPQSFSVIIGIEVFLKQFIRADFSEVTEYLQSFIKIIGEWHRYSNPANEESLMIHMDMKHRCCAGFPFLPRSGLELVRDKYRVAYKVGMGSLAYYMIKSRGSHSKYDRMQDIIQAQIKGIRCFENNFLPHMQKVAEEERNVLARRADRAAVLLRDVHNYPNALAEMIVSYEASSPPGFLPEDELLEICGSDLFSAIEKEFRDKVDPITPIRNRDRIKILMNWIVAPEGLPIVKQLKRVSMSGENLTAEYISRLLNAEVLKSVLQEPDQTIIFKSISEIEKQPALTYAYSIRSASAMLQTSTSSIAIAVVPPPRDR